MGTGAAQRQRVVIALGGNALLQRGERPDSDIQEAHVASAVAALVPLLGSCDVILTHGNGPQVGVLALESAQDPELSRPYPFGVLGAQTQGMIGYWIVQALSRALPSRPAACLITRTVVRAGDPAFRHPGKFVGPVYDEDTAHAAPGAGGSQAAAGRGSTDARPGPAPEAAGRAAVTPAQPGPAVPAIGDLRPCSGPPARGTVGQGQP